MEEATANQLAVEQHTSADQDTAAITLQTPTVKQLVNLLEDTEEGVIDMLAPIQIVDQDPHIRDRDNPETRLSDLSASANPEEISGQPEETLQQLAGQAEAEWSIQRSRRKRKDALELRHLSQENIIRADLNTEPTMALPRLTRAGKSLHHD